MKKIVTLLTGACALLAAPEVRSADIEYGDLYNVEWCPCNPEEAFDEQGSVVMGKTVMCPCSGMYSGYKKGFEQDIREIKQAANAQLRKLNYFKYYLGMDYNIGSMSASSDKVTFDDTLFASQQVSVSPDDIFDDQDSLSFVAGVRVSKHWGLEAFYQQTYDDNNATFVDNVTLNNPNYHLMSDYTTNFKAFGADFVGYLPLSPYFDFVGTLGLAQYRFENEAAFTTYYVDGSNPRDVTNKNFDEDKIGWRAGVGAQLNIADGVALRAMYRYIHIGGDTMDNMNEVSIGLRFLF